MNETATYDNTYRVSDTLAGNYLDRHEGLTINSATARTYDGILNEYNQWLCDHELTVLTASCDDVQNYIEHCVKRGNRKGTLSSKLSVISELYRYIYLETESMEKLNLDPLKLRKIDIDRYNTLPKIERGSLTRKEIRSLFDAFQSYRNRLMAIVGTETGLRNSDIRGLRLEDIYSDHIHAHNPKGSRPYNVPISEDLYFELEYWKNNIRDGYTFASLSEYVFPSQNGPKLESNGSLTKIIKEAASRAGIQQIIGRSQLDPTYVEDRGLSKSFREWHRVTPHTLRHSFITLLEEDGVSLTYRMLVSNHRNADTNLGYTHNGSEVVNYIRNNFNPPR